MICKGPGESGWVRNGLVGSGRVSAGPGSSVRVWKGYDVYEGPEIKLQVRLCR